MSMDIVLDRLGRVSIGLRCYVGGTVVLNDAEPHAYTLANGDIHLLWDCAMDTGIHESGHSFGFATATPQSKVEDFPQMKIKQTYMLLYNGHLPPGFRADCMSHQLDLLGAVPLRPLRNTCRIVDGVPGTRCIFFNSNISWLSCSYTPKARRFPSNTKSRASLRNCTDCLPRCVDTRCDIGTLPSPSSSAIPSAVSAINLLLALLPTMVLI
ncbi:hypothetical protein B0H19DRAFT_1253420 [Mycena capillaripes]|nr:hypothetical protein B0H19DRAFT_1253420 [Mycena capillaripes]